MDGLIWLIYALLSALSLAYDPSLSNGTCYYGVNKKAADSFIPCGNAAGSVQSCCQARDVCLSSNACFNGQYYITYLAGCTDQDYESPECPDKGQFPDQQWVGLVRCGVSDGVGEQWGPCQEPAQPTINKGNQQCTCDASRSTAVFTDAATLTNIASLPVSAGNAIAFFPGFEPSTTVTSSTTTRSGSTRTSSGGTSSNTATPATSSNSFAQPSATALPVSSQPSLSTAAKAGIGAGTAGGAFVIAALLGWFVWYRRRKNRSIPPIKDQIRPSSVGPWGPRAGDPINGIGPVTGNRSNWGRSSELPTEANEITTTKTSLGENTIRSSFNTPTTTYQPYQHSPTAEASEIDGSPAASTSRLAQSSSAYEKPVYQKPVFELPG